MQRTLRVRRTFGAIDFELLTDGVTVEQLSAWEPRFAQPHDDLNALAHAVCAVSFDPSMAEPTRASGFRSRAYEQLACEQSSDGRWSIRGRGIAAELECTVPSRYAVSARLAPDALGVRALLRGVASAIAAAQGGLVMRAAALELDGRCVLFVGEQAESAAQAASGDRRGVSDSVALVPNATGALVWALPGANAPVMALSRDAVLPVGAVLCVQRASERSAPALARASGGAELSIVRDSLECGAASGDSGARYDTAVSALCARVAVGTITLPLGAPQLALLRETLARWSGP